MTITNNVSSCRLQEIFLSVLDFVLPQGNVRLNQAEVWYSYSWTVLFIPYLTLGTSSLRQECFHIQVHSALLQCPIWKGRGKRSKTCKRYRRQTVTEYNLDLDIFETYCNPLWWTERAWSIIPDECTIHRLTSLKINGPSYLLRTCHSSSF